MPARRPGGALGRRGTQALLFAYPFLHGFLNPDTTALALAPFPHAAGSAAALPGSLQMLAASLASALVGLLFDGSALPMAAVMAVCAAAGLALVWRKPAKPGSAPGAGRRWAAAPSHPPCGSSPSSSSRTSRRRTRLLAAWCSS